MKRALVTLLIFLAACGGKSSSYDYEVALDPGWYTLEAPGREGALTAFSTELMEEIGRAEGLNIEVLGRSWNNLLYGLQAKQYNAIFSTMQPYVFYEKQYDFSDLYLLTGPTVVVPADADISSLNDFDAKLVGVQRDSDTALLLEKYPNIIQRTYDSIPQALNDVADGIIEGAAVEILLAEAYIQDLFNGQLKIAFPPLTQDGIRVIAIHGQAPKFIKSFNEGLKKLKKNGKYDELVRKWGLTENR